MSLPYAALSADEAQYATAPDSAPAWLRSAHAGATEPIRWRHADWIRSIRDAYRRKLAQASFPGHSALVKTAAASAVAGLPTVPTPGGDPLASPRRQD